MTGRATVSTPVMNCPEIGAFQLDRLDAVYNIFSTEGRDVDRVLREREPLGIVGMYLLAYNVPVIITNFPVYDLILSTLLSTLAMDGCYWSFETLGRYDYLRNSFE